MPYFEVNTHPMSYLEMQAKFMVSWTESEKERELDGMCEETGQQHTWLLFPAWRRMGSDGGNQKHYILCLDCQEHGDL